VSCPRGRSGGQNLRPCSRQRPGNQDFVRHAEIGSPVDGHPLRVDLLECASAVEHHDDRFHAIRPAGFAQPAPGRDKERRADFIQADRVGRCQHIERHQRRNAAQFCHRRKIRPLPFRGGVGVGPRPKRRDIRSIPTPDPSAEGEGRRKAVGDTKRAVVQRRVTPDEQRDHASTGQVGADRFAPHPRNRIMPRVDATQIIGIPAVAHGHVEFGKACGGIGQHLATDIAAQFCQIGLSRPFARYEDQVRPVDFPDRLKRQMLRIAGADADQHEFDHVAGAIR